LDANLVGTISPSLPVGRDTPNFTIQIAYIPLVDREIEPPSYRISVTLLIKVSDSS